MIKFFGGVVLGVFVGALTVEVLGRTHPELLEKVQDKARRTADRLNDLVKGRQSLRDYATTRREMNADMY